MSSISYYNNANEEIVRYTQNRELLESHLNSNAGVTDVDKVFTRNSKFNLKHLLTFLIMPRTESTTIELERFCNIADIKPITKQTFFQKRRYINTSMLWNIHNSLLLQSYADSSDRATFHGRYLLAVDGSTIALPNSDELAIKFVKNSTMSTPLARLLVIRDVLNGEIVYLSISPYTASEYDMTIQALEKIPYYIKDNAIFIFDRGFAASWMFTYLNKLDIEYIIRLPHGFNKNVANFFQTEEFQTDTRIEISRPKWSTSAKKRFEKLGIQNAGPLYLHLCGVFLPQGEREVLAVRVHNYRFNCSEIKKLYSYRWRVETSIDELKNELQLEIFSGHSVLAVEQDIASKTISYNLGQQLAREANKLQRQKECSKNDSLNHTDRASSQRWMTNKNIMWYILQRLIVQYFSSSDKAKDDILKSSIHLVQMNQELIRPGRHEPHTKRIIHNRGKYITFTNYRRAL